MTSSTAVIIGAVLSSRFEVIDDLSEVHHGTFAGLTNSEIEVHYPGALRRRELNKDAWGFPAGESYAAASVRAARSLEQVAEDAWVACGVLLAVVEVPTATSEL